MAYQTLFLCTLFLLEDCEVLQGLPLHDYALQQWMNGCRLVADLEKEQKLGGFYAEKVGTVLGDARLLCLWWGLAADATNPQVCFADRLEKARWARMMCDWRLWGWPPSLPYWYFPTWKK